MFIISHTMESNTPTSGMSALEKARALKLQKEQEKQELEQQQEAQEQQVSEEAQNKYNTLIQEISNLEQQVTEIQEKISEQEAVAQQALQSLRGAAKELNADAEGKEIWKDTDTRAEILGPEKTVVLGVRRQQQELQQQITEIKSQIESKTTESQEVFKETKEGSMEMEKQKIELEKVEQEELKNTLEELYVKRDSLAEDANREKESIKSNKKNIEIVTLELFSVETKNLENLNSGIILDSQKNYVFLIL